MLVIGSSAASQVAVAALFLFIVVFGFARALFKGV